MQVKHQESWRLGREYPQIETDYFWVCLIPFLLKLRIILTNAISEDDGRIIIFVDFGLELSSIIKDDTYP